MRQADDSLLVIFDSFKREVKRRVMTRAIIKQPGQVDKSLIVARILVAVDHNEGLVHKNHWNNRQTRATMLRCELLAVIFYEIKVSRVG